MTFPNCKPMRATSLLAATLVAAVALLAPARQAAADVVTVKSGTAQIADEGTVLRVENGQIVIKSKASGREKARPLEHVIKIKLDDEPKFNAAEDAYAAGNTAAAATGYQQALTATQREWVKDRALQRLVEAAQKSGQYPAAVTAFVEMAKRDPVQANKAKPAIPQGNPTALAPVIAEVRKAYDGNVKPESRQLLRTYLVDLYLAAGDPKSADALVKTAGPVPAAPTTPEAAAPGAIPAAPADNAAATRAINEAKIAMAQKDYPRVLNTIRASKTAFTDPDQQFEALYMMAEAESGGAGNDAARLTDAGVAYMRIVAHFGNRTSDPRYADALVKAAGIVERLQKPNEALSLYNQVATDPKFKNTPAAAEAAKAVARLKASAQR
jgi:hypothetical protein